MVFDLKKIKGNEEEALRVSGILEYDFLKSYLITELYKYTNTYERREDGFVYLFNGISTVYGLLNA